MTSLSQSTSGGAATPAPAAPTSSKKQINRTFTPDQELALATEIVTGKITVEVQKGHTKVMVVVDLARGFPYGTKGKYWSAVTAHLNSKEWAHAFPSTAPACASTCETNWERLLAKRITENSRESQKRIRKEGDSKACSGGGNSADWNSGAGDKSSDDDDDADTVTTSGSKARATSTQDKIDSLLDTYISKVANFTVSSAAANKENEKEPAASTRKAASGQPGEDKGEVESAIIGGVPCVIL
jgi:hypothetical protein